jgi:hypothetical protein
MKMPIFVFKIEENELFGIIGTRNSTQRYLSQVERNGN